MTIVDTNATSAKIADFFIDYIIYEASANSTISGSDAKTSFIFVDDTSSYLEYSSDWTHTVTNFPGNADFNLTDATYNSSVMAPTSPWATVSLEFFGMITDSPLGSS